MSSDESEGERFDALLRELAGPPPMRASIALGTRLGSYILEEELGRGGMGVVYRARDERLGRDVALKVLSRSDPEAARRLLREARAAAAVHHPQVAAVYELGQADGRDFIAMELVEGRPLRELLAKGRIPRRVRTRIARDVAAALAVAHSKGVIHRDLKPENVMVTPEGHAKVLDFGIAHRGMEVEGRSSADTHGEGTSAAGTPGYASPEQQRGAPIDSRSDVWAFGVLLHEMATGARPRSGSSARFLVRRCLAEHPDERPANGAALLEALDRERRRRRAASIGVGSIMVAAATVLAWRVGGSHEPHSPREFQPRPAERAERLAILERLTGQTVDERIAHFTLTRDGKTLALLIDDATSLQDVASGDRARIERAFDCVAPFGMSEILVRKDESTFAIDAGGRLREMRTHPHSVYHCPLYSPDMSTVAAWEPGAVVLRRAQDFGELWRSPSWTNVPSRLVWSPGGRWLATITALGHDRGARIQLVDARSGATHSVFEDVRLTQIDSTWSLGFLSDGALVFGLAALVQQRETGGLYALSIDDNGEPTGPPRQLAHVDGACTHLAVSESGDVAVEVTKSRHDVHRATLVDSGRRLTNVEGLLVSEDNERPSALDARGQLLFMREHAMGHRSYLLHQDGRQERLTGVGEWATWPAALPDGGIAYFRVVPDESRHRGSLELIRRSKPDRPMAAFEIPLRAGARPPAYSVRLKCTHSECLLREQTEQAMVVYKVDLEAGVLHESLRVSLRTQLGGGWALSPDGEQLVMIEDGTYPYQLVVFDRQGEILERIPMECDPFDVALGTRHDMYVTGACDSHFYLFHIDAERRLTELLKNGAHWFHQPLPSPDGSTLTFGSSEYNDDIWLLRSAS